MDISAKIHNAAIAPNHSSIKPREDMHRTLSAFIKQAQSPSPPMITRAGLGCTGATFICSHGKQEFVLKWQKRAFCINELVCNTIFHSYGFHTPLPILVDAQHLSTPLVPIFLPKNSSMYVPNDKDDLSYDFIFMDKVPGSNFKEFLATGSFLTLTPSNRQSMFRTFGSIVPFDLLIGNSDRFLRIRKDFENNFSPDWSEPSDYLNPDPSMNYGNIMLELVELGDTKKVVVHFIDSTTNSRMLDPENIPREVQPNNYLGGLFTGSDEPTSPGQSSSPTKKMQLDAEQKERFETCFTHLFEKIFTTPEVLAEHVTKSICTGIEEVYKMGGLDREGNQWKQILKAEGNQYSDEVLAGIRSGCSKMIETTEDEIFLAIHQRFQTCEMEEVKNPDLLGKNLRLLRSNLAPIDNQG